MILRTKSKYVAAARPASNAGVTLYCSEEQVACHWIRLVLSEKAVTGARIELQGPGQTSEDLAMLNSAQTLPTLTDRETVIHPARLIAEFLEERYPHPPMMPPEAAVRARLRMFMLMIESEWLPLLKSVEKGTPAASKKARKELTEQLALHARLFPSRGWFLGLDFGLTDCAITALLWRMATLKLQLPANSEPIRRYAERAFARAAFPASLIQPRKSMGARGRGLSKSASVAAKSAPVKKVPTRSSKSVSENDVKKK